MDHRADFGYLRFADWMGTAGRFRRSNQESRTDRVFDVYGGRIDFVGRREGGHVPVQSKKEQNSASLKAVSVDCLSDAVSTAVVLLSLIVNAIFSINVDGWCGILVSLFIMYNGLTTCTETIERIMGRSASKEQLAEMRTFAFANGDFENVVDLQIEDYGYGRYRVSMTVLGRETASTDRLLADAMALKYRIYEKYGYNAQISVEKNIPVSDELRSFVENALSKTDVPLKILSLRVNEAREHKLALLNWALISRINIKRKNWKQQLSRVCKMSRLVISCFPVYG